MRNRLLNHSYKVLIIDDDHAFRKSVKYGLKEFGLEAYYAESVEQALDRFAKSDYDLIIMDLQFAEMDGVALLKYLRENRSSVPIIIVSSCGSIPWNLSALDAGADLVFEKSMPLDYLLGHARALCQRNEARRARQEYDHGNLTIDVPSRTIAVQGRPLDLKRKEFDIFSYLASHPNHVLSRDQIYERIWGLEPVYDVDETIRHYIKSLRKKLSLAGKNYIKTVWGIGYKFDPTGS